MNLPVHLPVHLPVPLPGALKDLPVHLPVHLRVHPPKLDLPVHSRGIPREHPGDHAKQHPREHAGSLHTGWLADLRVPGDFRTGGWMLAGWAPADWRGAWLWLLSGCGMAGCDGCLGGRLAGGWRLDVAGWGCCWLVWRRPGGWHVRPWACASGGRINQRTFKHPWVAFRRQSHGLCKHPFTPYARR